MTKRLGLVYSIILVTLLAVPTLGWLAMGERANQLYGYVDKVPERPANTGASLLDKTWQTWAGRYYDVHFGFRTELIRTFNEILFRAFREMPRLRLYSTPEMGLYSGMSLQYINTEILEKSEREAKYAVTAGKLRQVQTLLEAQGKAFMVVIAASKPYVYPESLGRRYLAGGPDQVFERTASFGRALQAAGVNVIDSAPLLRDFRRDTNVALHPESGVHWNYYAGCLVAEQIMDRVRNRFPALQPFGCGVPRYEQAQGADTDGLSLMNIWSGGGVYKNTPQPSVLEGDTTAWRPSLVFISDSFSDEILAPLNQGRAYSRAVNSGYFRVRALDENGDGGHRTHDVDADPELTRKQVLADIAASDVVVLQIVDYNLGGDTFGFPEYVLAQHAAGALPAAAPLRQQGAPAAGAALKMLAFVDVDNRSNPIQVPTRTRLVANTAQLLALAAESEWDLVAVLQKSGRRSGDLGRELEKQGYTVVADGKEGLLALPRRSAGPAVAKTSWQWLPYGDLQGATATVQHGLPLVASAQPADIGLYSQEVMLEGPVLIRARFEGTVAGGSPRAAHLSWFGLKPIFSLQEDTYAANEEFFAIVPGQRDGKPARLAFGLGGWARGSGTLRLKTLEFHPLSLHAKDAPYPARTVAAGVAGE